MIYWQLFWSFIQIGLFSFGGGYAALPLIQKQVVTVHGWLTIQEFSDVVTISQMTPGPISLNAASFVGTRIGGVAGAVVATVGNVLPSLIIVLTLAWFYFRYRSLKVMQGALYGLRPAVVALIASAGLAILFLALFGKAELPISSADISWFAVIMFVLAFIYVRVKKPNPIIIIALSGGITVLLGLIGIPI
ncbi:MAG: chromate transporter [Sphaerochaetaceae bacterium]|jgi:chromate transporter|nr:chromate transporter [Sphaerochaetaceae bacterium]MDY0372436.1 chromate transporter [Sphaerochaetaceae bacterium]